MSLSLPSLDRHTKAMDALVFFLSGVSLIVVLIEALHGYSPFALDTNLITTIAAIAGPLLFISAAVCSFSRSRLASLLGILAGAITVPLLVWRESFNFYYANPWIVQNLSNPRDAEIISFCEWRIISTLLVVVALILALLRVLPERFLFRSKPLSKRTWPPFAGAFVVAALWFIKGAVPYRIPMIVDGVDPELTVVRIEKRGMRFNESSVTVWRDRRFTVSRGHRYWFRYQSPVEIQRGVLAEDLSQQEHVVVSQIRLNHAVPGFPPTVKCWDCTGWYVKLDRQAIFVFSLENGRTPPLALTQFFEQAEAAQGSETYEGNIRDVCLGFCYDPAAALGIVFVNERCRTSGDRTTCY